MIDQRKKLQAVHKKYHCDALLISSVPHIIYLTGYSGFSQIEREAYLLITKRNQYLLTDGRYTTAVKKLVPDFQIIEHSAKQTIVQNLQEIISNEKITAIGFEATNLTVAEYTKFSTIKISWKHITLDTLRIQKTAQEIKTIQKACDIGDKAFLHIQSYFKKGVSEQEIALEMELFIKKNNADLSFSTIVAFGENAAVPHHQTKDKRLKTNDYILLDFGVKFENYCSDMTRTIFFGSATNKQKNMYEIVRMAQQKAVDYINNNLAMKQSNNEPINLSASEIDHAARSYIISQGYPSIPHSLGHGIGIEVHEAPRLSPNSKEILEEGMVFSIEPGIYIPDFGGVRIEDLFTIQRNKLIQLTKSSKNLTVL